MTTEKETLRARWLTRLFVISPGVTAFEQERRARSKNGDYITGVHIRCRALSEKPDLSGIESLTVFFLDGNATVIALSLLPVCEGGWQMYHALGCPLKAGRITGVRVKARYVGSAKCGLMVSVKVRVVSPNT